MRYQQNYLFLFVGVLLLVSCTSTPQKHEQRELLPDPEKYVHDGYLQQPDSLKPQFKPDETIATISLLSANHVDELLGKNIMEQLTEENATGLPAAHVLSDDGKQQLHCYFHPGGTKKEFAEFQVSYTQEVNRTKHRVSEKEFVTESGIKLGRTIGDLRAIKGEPDSIINAEATVFHYQIDDFESSAFLKHYNMPIYYADYTFVDGYLIAFKFGFQYP